MGHSVQSVITITCAPIHPSYITHVCCPNFFLSTAPPPPTTPACSPDTSRGQPSRRALSANWDSGFARSGVKGPLIWGSRSLMLISITSSYSAPASARRCSLHKGGGEGKGGKAGRKELGGRARRLRGHGPAGRSADRRAAWTQCTAGQPIRSTQPPASPTPPHHPPITRHPTTAPRPPT